MNILILANIPSPYRVSFFNKLAENYNVTVVYERKSAKDRDKSWVEKREIKYHQFFMNSIKVGTDCSISLSFLGFINKKYDIICISGWASPTIIMAVAYMRIINCRYIISMDGAILKTESKIKSFIKKSIISHAQAGLCTGKLSREYLIHYGLIDNNIYTYPFTSQSDADISSAVSMLGKKEYYRKKIGVNENTIILSIGNFLGNNAHRKGFDLLIEVARKLDKNVGIYIVGGEPTNELVKLKAEYKLDNLHYISFKNKSELAEYYAASDIFILLTRYDVWGLVINEAMSFGLPVITTDMCVAGMELIENEINGFIIPSEDTGAAYNALLSLINDKVLREKISFNNINKINNYSIEKMATSHAAIFENIISKKDSNG